MEIGFDTIGNATLIVYDGRPLLATDPWIKGRVCPSLARDPARASGAEALGERPSPPRRGMRLYLR